MRRAGGIAQEASCRAQWLLAGFVMVAALAVYILTLAPGITWSHDGQDGGDLITAMMTGGVPHPPGYPTYLLLASPLARLPFGNPAWRLNLFSALCAAGAASLTTLAVMRLAQATQLESNAARIAGTVAGLALAFSPVLWSQAVIAEVYTLGALITALLFLLYTLLQDQRSWRALAFGATFGLALGASPTLTLNGLLAFLAVDRRWKAWTVAGLGLGLGLGVFLVLPLRALNRSPVNWGGASTLSGFWWLTSAQLYRGYVLALPLDSLGVRLLAWASMTARQLTPVGALIAGWGFARLWKVSSKLAGVTLAMFAGWSVFAIGYNTTDSYVHLIPAFVIMAIWLGEGLADLVGKLDLTGFKSLLGLLPLVLPLALLIIGWSAADLHQDHAAADFGQMIMTYTPHRAILLTVTDAHTFTLWYYRYVLGRRPDVTIVDRDMLDMPWYQTTLARESGWAIIELPDPAAELAHLGRPLCQINQTHLECK